ncbi:DNA-directed RNA polymerase [Cutibacterium acnes JCM 18920]|nr:DNA-directed RNA polymerase [Cutibacterium acnes JCM 18920]
MAVHLPLSPEAQAEARVLMLSTNNILKPADGRPVALPSHEMIIGAYYLTMALDGLKGEGRAFTSLAEAIMAHDLGELEIGAKIKLRLKGIVPPHDETVRADGSVILDTTLGQALFNEVLPDDYPYVDFLVGKKQIGKIVNDLSERMTQLEVAHVLDNLKDIGYKWGSLSGVTVSIGDVQTPPTKPEILAGYETRAAKVDREYDRGAVTEEERRQDLIQIWTEATAELTAAMELTSPRLIRFT